jgi:CubicO group peptidase (beta-lactamase class C family)
MSRLDSHKAGEALGAQLHISHEGKEVVNLHGQYNEPSYNEDSLQMVFSSTKVMSPIVIALMVERNLLSYSGKYSFSIFCFFLCTYFVVPISKYWPEFAQHGKESITLEDLMKHEGKELVS